MLGSRRKDKCIMVKSGGDRRSKGGRGLGSDPSMKGVESEGDSGINNARRRGENREGIERKNGQGKRKRRCTHQVYQNSALKWRRTGS